MKRESSLVANTVTFHRLFLNAPPPLRGDRAALGTLPAAAFQYCEPVRVASSFGWYIFPPVDIVIAIVADNRASLIGAGWVVTARALGDLLATITLPAIGVNQLGRLSTMVIAALMIAAFWIATADNLNLIVFGFLAVGFCSGVLKYLGTMAASGYLNRGFAFVFRLSLVLIIAGATTISLLSTGSFASFTALLNGLMLLLLLLSLIGITFYRPTQHHKESLLERSAEAHTGGLVGLLILGMFFIGISGFMAYVGERAMARGYPRMIRS